MSIILASASPRRRELLSLITTDFEIIVSEADETLPESIAPEQAVMELAARKAAAVSKSHPDRAVIGSDTVVAVDGEILGKPIDDADAVRMLKLLSGRKHHVFTGLCIAYQGKNTVFYDGAAVEFAEMSEAEIADYVASGEPRDKAGAYAIQGLASKFITSISGDYYSVVGLPVSRLYKSLKDLKVL